MPKEKLKNIIIYLRRVEGEGERPFWMGYDEQDEAFEPHEKEKLRRARPFKAPLALIAKVRIAGKLVITPEMVKEAARKSKEKA